MGEDVLAGAALARESVLLELGSRSVLLAGLLGDESDASVLRWQDTNSLSKLLALFSLVQAVVIFGSFP
jgi:hypothetical protein